MVLKKKRVISGETRKRISDGVRQYHKKCKENTAKLSKLTKVTGKKKYFS